MCSRSDVIAVNFDEPKYDLDTYWGRVKQLLERNNPLHLIVWPNTLEEARCLYDKYRCVEPLPDDVDEAEMWRAKSIYESAYDPETGDKINYLARPATQVPMNALMAGGMMAYFLSTPGVILWHWANQTYNAFVSYNTKGKDVTFTDNQLMTSYVLTTGTAIATALTLNRMLQRSSCLVRRFVPLAAVSMAHCVGSPLMRAQVLKNGTPIYDDNNNKLGYSKRAAQAGITGVILNKILWAVPPMTLTPLFMNYLDKRGTLCRYPWLNFPAHVAVAGFCLTFISPLLCALLTQKGNFPHKHLEPEMREYLCKKFHDRPPKYVYYNRDF